jgi:vancomycin aglycone glucosyltransferase
MPVFVSASGARGCVQPVVRRAVRPPMHRATSPPADPPRRAAELVAAPFDTVAAVAEGCDPLVVRGVMPEGVWR